MQQDWHACHLTALCINNCVQTQLILSQHAMLAVSAAALAARVKPLPTGEVQELSLEEILLPYLLLAVGFLF